MPRAMAIFSGNRRERLFGYYGCHRCFHFASGIDVDDPSALVDVDRGTLPVPRLRNSKGEQEHNVTFAVS
jgi:hypothetical protein